MNLRSPICTTMTNIATSDTEIVEKIKQAKWWQGSVIEDEQLRTVEPTLPQGFPYWVMASQTCNLYNKDLCKISKVEWVGATKMDKSEPSLRGGRHPRLLETKASNDQGEVWLVCHGQERHWGRRGNMASVRPSMGLKNTQNSSQSEQHKDNFAAWMARAYTRLELSNELGDALAKGKFMAAIEKIVEAHEADIFGIFIRAYDEKNNPPEHVKPPCNLDLRIVVSAANKVDGVSKKVEEVFSEKNIPRDGGKISRIKALGEDFKVVVHPIAMPAARWTATLIESHLRFNFNDHLSGPDEAGVE